MESNAAKGRKKRLRLKAPAEGGESSVQNNEARKKFWKESAQRGDAEGLHAEGTTPAKGVRKHAAITALTGRKKAVHYLRGWAQQTKGKG